ncbi:MAG: hypothetical protein P8105_09565, partial [Dehalococcoidia bacterium]
MSKSRSSMFLAVLNLLGFLGVLVVNALANALPINGITTGELSDLYPNLFVPAGLTFSIWGVIYVLLALFIVFQIISVIKRSAQGLAFTGRIGIFFFISCIANMGWIFAWHYRILTLSLVIMLLLLGSLITIYIRLRIGRSGASKSERYMVHLPFSVYLGWITIATIANVTALLVDAGWNNFGLSGQFWAVLVIAIGIAITLIVLSIRRDVFYALVVDWA